MWEPSDDEFPIMLCGTIDFMDEKSICEILVYPQEHTTEPHFHIKSLNSEFETALRIDVCEYYNGHLEFVGCTLNKLENQILNTVLRSGYNGFTMWQHIKINWNLVNPDNSIKDETLIQPNYNALI